MSADQLVGETAEPMAEQTAVESVDLKAVCWDVYWAALWVVWRATEWAVHLVVWKADLLAFLLAGDSAVWTVDSLGGMRAENWVGDSVAKRADWKAFLWVEQKDYKTAAQMVGLMADETADMSVA